MSVPRAEILSQGDEVVTGQVADTNAAWLSERLTEMGVIVVRHTAVGDRRADIIEAVRTAAKRAEIVLGTGGLGPTDDDLTNEAVAAAFARPLVLDAEALLAIEGFFAAIGRPMAAVNRKQAMLPEGALRLDNDAGTAPGFAIDAGTSWLAFMPGVPREMKRMFLRIVAPVLRARFDLPPARLVTVRCAGIGESAMQERVGSLDHPRLAIGTRTMLPENHLKLRAGIDASDDELRATALALARRIGEPVFAIEGLGDPGGSLAEVVARALASRGETVAASETASAGLVASQLLRGERTAAQGVAVFAGGEIVRGEPTDDGATVARARSVAVRFAAPWGIATGAVFGDERPAVTVAVAGPATDEVRTLPVFGDEERRHLLAAGAALDLLRRALGIFPAR